MNQGSKFSNTPLSRDIAESFLHALSIEDIKEILNSCEAFGDSQNWRPYGNAEKNWDRVGAQTSEPVGALAELIINSIDAILMKGAKEQDIDARSEDAPKTMSEAVKRFFPGVTEGRLNLLSADERTQLAEKSVLIGIKRGSGNREYPNYTIVDFGEGQNHKDFPTTFLSLGEKNKEGIPFVQGRFNMGSTGSITFCTRSEIPEGTGMYKFVLSKRNMSDSDGLWGWTLIRARSPKAGESLPVVEYFSPEGAVPSFEADEIQALNRRDIGVLKAGGSVVKLYEYDIGTPARSVDLGLSNALTTSLIDCALPIRLYDFDAKPMRTGLRAEGIAERTFSGMKTVLTAEKQDGEEGSGSSQISGFIENSEIPELGSIRISYYGLYEMTDYLKKQNNRVFYTINGQTQAKETAGFLGRAKLDDLRNHLIVEIDCNAMNSTARSLVFKADRERMAQTKLTKKLRETVLDTLAREGSLREFAQTIRDRRVTERPDDEDDKRFLSELVQNSPDLKELFVPGDVDTPVKPVIRVKQEYEGKQFPSYLIPRNLEEGNVKRLPINASRRIECDTDVENNYLLRESNRGEFIHPPPAMLPHSESLRDGTLRIRVLAPANAKEGDEIPVEFGFNDPSQSQPMTFPVTIHITKEEPPVSPSPDPSPVPPRPSSVEFPEIRWAPEKDWGTHGYDESSGGHVSRGDKLVIFVNEDNKYLLSLLQREVEEQKRELIRRRFKYGVGILTFAMYKRLVIDTESEEDASGSGDYDNAMRLASSAIAPHVVTLIEKLSGDR